MTMKKIQIQSSVLNSSLLSPAFQAIPKPSDPSVMAILSEDSNDSYVVWSDKQISLKLGKDSTKHHNTATQLIYRPSLVMYIHLTETIIKELRHRCEGCIAYKMPSPKGTKPEYLCLNY